MNAPATRCYCPACQTRAALQLLESGRVAMATSIVRDMVECLDAAERQNAAEAAALAAVVAAEPEMPPQRRTRQKGRPRAGKPPFQRLATELRDHVARLGPHRVAELLGIQVSDLVTLMEGRADVSKDALKRVRAAEA